ncbi:MAG: hypothetical protein O2895_04310 [Chloroflexi bacterium]|nr:hypothetical protein [Chloroflexota bacterium]
MRAYDSLKTPTDVSQEPDFPTIVWYEVEYSVYTMRQASRRSWRIGQRHPVRVIYFAYRGTLQAQALQLTAKKLQASLAVEGDLVEEGLAAHGTDGDDLLLALARSLSAGDEVSEESLEGLFREVQAVADAAKEALDREEAGGAWIGAELPGPQHVQVSVGGSTQEVARPSAQPGEQLRLL